MSVIRVSIFVLASPRFFAVSSISFAIPFASSGFSERVMVLPSRDLLSVASALLMISRTFSSIATGLISEQGVLMEMI